MRILFSLLVALTICILAYPSLGFGQEYSGEAANFTALLPVMSENYPCPFSPPTYIPLTLQNPTSGIMYVYDIHSDTSMILDSIKMGDLTPGRHQIDVKIVPPTSGLYMYLFNAEDSLKKSGALTPGLCYDEKLDALWFNLKHSSSVKIAVVNKDGVTIDSMNIGRLPSGLCELYITEKNWPHGFYRLKIYTDENEQSKEFLFIRSAGQIETSAQDIFENPGVSGGSRETKFEFLVPDTCHCHAVINNQEGEFVDTLMNDILSPHVYGAKWQEHDVDNGIYYIEYSICEEEKTRSVVHWR